jgi:hypothetical protein
MDSSGKQADTLPTLGQHVNIIRKCRDIRQEPT